MRHIVFQGEKYEKIDITISSQASFASIVRQINYLTFPVPNDENIRYALLELINNSLRAHIQNHITQPIQVTLAIDQGELDITIEDHGPGFNPDELPYDIHQPVEEIDTNSEQFQTYREQHHYTQFGLGLIIARRTFPNLEIHTTNATTGTRIHARKRITP